jgi:hypothetical protein
VLHFAKGFVGTSIFQGFSQIGHRNSLQFRQDSQLTFEAIDFHSLRFILGLKDAKLLGKLRQPIGASRLGPSLGGRQWRSARNLYFLFFNNQRRRVFLLLVDHRFHYHC